MAESIDSRPHDLAGCRRRHDRANLEQTPDEPCHPDCGCRCHLEMILTRVKALQGALSSIAGTVECENYSQPPYCRGPGSSRRRGATYSGDQWCNVCIARDALERAT